MRVEDLTKFEGECPNILKTDNYGIYMYKMWWNKCYL